MVFLELLDQIVVELRHQGHFVSCRARYSQVVQDQSQQLGETEMSVKYEGRMHGGLHTAHQPSE